MQGSETLHTSTFQEEDLITENFIDAYLAYSPAGEAEGQLVYVNFGTKSDFELLSNASSPYFTNITGRICISRYGQIFRGNKAQNAADAGCAGLIIFSDPADVAGEGQEPENVYPNTMFLPDTGIQRGNNRITSNNARGNYQFFTFFLRELLEGGNY